eukprot:5201632-Alexandrium_andersonii.AAC.1
MNSSISSSSMASAPSARTTGSTPGPLDVAGAADRSSPSWPAPSTGLATSGAAGSSATTAWSCAL